MQEATMLISEDEWLERFRPKLNLIEKNAAVDFCDGGISFETYGEELEYVRSVDPACVWTLMTTARPFVADSIL